MMRRLISILVWLGVFYSLYWVGVSQALQRGPARAANVLAAQGIDLAVGDITTTGYPARFLTALSDLRVAGPDWVWQVPQITLDAASNYPVALTVLLPADQRAVIASQTLDLRSENLLIDVALRPMPDLPLDRLQVAMGQAVLMSDAPWQAKVAGLQAGFVRLAGHNAIYDTDIALAGLVLPDLLRARIDPADVLGAQVAALQGTAQLTFAAPLDRHLQGRLPDLVHTTLHDLQLDWGPVTLTLTGDVAIDADGVPTGVITAQTRQWQIVVDVLVIAGVMDARAATAITGLAGFMAGSDGMLRVPIAFREGVMLVGPVPVGPAPRLR